MKIELKYLIIYDGYDKGIDKNSNQFNPVGIIIAIVVVVSLIFAIFIVSKKIKTKKNEKK